MRVVVQGTQLIEDRALRLCRVANDARLLLFASVWLGRAMAPLSTLTGTTASQWPMTGGLATMGGPAAGGVTPSGFAAPGSAPTAPMTSAGADALVDRLARLADLRDRGILTEAEFQAQKAKLL